MPMIDVFAEVGTFSDPHQLARDVAAAVMQIEQVPDIPMFRSNTAGFVHDLAAGGVSDVEGAGGQIRVQVLTNAGALDRAQQLAIVERLTGIVTAAAATAEPRVWVLLTEAVEGGWGLAGHAHTNPELVQAARDEIARLSA